MDKDKIIDGLRMTMDLCVFDPSTGEEIDPDMLNDINRATYDACKGALEILERLDTDSDTISRKAAIEAARDWYEGLLCGSFKGLEKRLRALPSAQPEIIRCTECKHYREYDSEYVENAVVVQCMADRYPISETIPDGWFCAGAERKDDE